LPIVKTQIPEKTNT